MALQETIEITTPVTGRLVVLRGYITGRIKQEIERVLFGSAAIAADGKASFSGATITDSNNRALQLIVVSVDGSSDNVLDAVLDMPETDYDFVKAEVDRIQRPLAPESETSSQTPSTTA